MYLAKLFSLALVVGVFFLSACYQGKLSESNSSIAPDADELEIWNESTTDEIQPSIWDITKRHNSFSTFSLLMEVAGLEETLKYEDQITVLAPTEEAFKLLGEGSIVELLKEDNRSVLQELLLSHIIPEVYHADDLQDGESRATLSGRRLSISRDTTIKLANATVTTADISASNGVVHIVDQVIIGE